MKRLALLLLPLMLAACEGAPDTPVVGTLERERLALRADRAEPVAALHVAEGARVTAGELLVQLDDSRARARLEEAEARRAQAEARLAELVRGPRRESILEARALAAEAEARLAAARADYRRVASLVSRDLLPEARLDEARSARDAAAAQLEAARARLEALLEGTTSEELDQARAALAAAEAAVRQAAVDLERLALRAPVAGRVDALPFEAGEQPPAGAAVAVLLADRPVYARVHIPQPLRARLQPGAAARIRLAGTQRVLAGKIRYLAAEAAYTPYYALTEYDRGRLSYLAEIVVEEPADALPTGVPVVVEFPQLGETGGD